MNIEESFERLIEHNEGEEKKRIIRYYAKELENKLVGIENENEKEYVVMLFAEKTSKILSKLTAKNMNEIMKRIDLELSYLLQSYNINREALFVEINTKKENLIDKDFFMCVINNMELEDNEKLVLKAKYVDELSIMQIAREYHFSYLYTVCTLQIATEKLHKKLISQVEGVQTLKLTLNN